MIRNKDMIIEIDYKFKYVGPKGKIETIRDADDYDNLREVEFIFNKLTDINNADFAVLPKEVKQDYINKLVEFHNRINLLAANKINNFNDILVSMA